MLKLVILSILFLVFLLVFALLLNWKINVFFLKKHNKKLFKKYPELFGQSNLRVKKDGEVEEYLSPLPP